MLGFISNIERMTGLISLVHTSSLKRVQIQLTEMVRHDTSLHVFIYKFTEYSWIYAVSVQIIPINATH